MTPRLANQGDRGQFPDVLSLEPSLVDELDIESAIEVEIGRAWKTIPSRTLEEALQGRTTSAAAWLRGKLIEGIQLDDADEVQSEKAEGGIRPLALLTLPQRVVYQALADRIKRRLPDSHQSIERWSTFLREALTEPDTRYVVHADVAAFYLFVDHELLATEIVNQTGDAEAADAIASLLYGLMGRSYGIPQLYPASDLFSELLIDIAERRLLRLGYSASRYRDDFRIATGTWAEARRAIESLDREIRSLGLVLNEQKTFVQKRENYEDWIEGPEKLWEQITEEVEADLQTFSIYTEEADEIEANVNLTDAKDVWVSAADRAIALWQEQDHSAMGRLNKRLYRQLLKRALEALTFYAAPVDLAALPAVIAIERDLTPWIGAYLRSIESQARSEVRATIRSAVSAGRYLSDWQSLWLLEGLFSRTSLPTKLTAWVRNCFQESRSGVLRARAALVLALKQEIAPDEISAAYEQVLPPARPDLVAAMTIVTEDNDPRLRAILESPIDGWIADFSGQFRT